MNRTENMHRLLTEEFDLCIIGGGASGAGCALDATLRGMKVALIERTDFAAETSSRSTKLIHGGVRYLEQAFSKLDFAQLRQVQHGLEERRIVLQNAPHLAHPLGLITPVFSWWEGVYFTVGLKLYDWFANRHSPSHPLPASRWLGKKEALELMPGLSDSIHSAVLYYDGQLDDARYCLSLVQSAAERGTVVANHLEVTGFQKAPTGKLEAVFVQDQLNTSAAFQIKARQFLNCTGPFSDQIRNMANVLLSPRIRPSKGVHIILPINILHSDLAMLIPKTRDGRVVFAIPFEGNLLLGTTDEPYPTVDNEPIINAKELDFLLDTLQPYVSKPLKKEDLKAGYGGIRPLLAPASTRGKANTTKSLLRDHEVEWDPVSGLFSLMGGKWTTYRLMSQDAIDAVIKAIDGPNQNNFFKKTTEISTEDYPLSGAKNYSPQLWADLRTLSGLDDDVCKHIASKYGTNASNLLKLTQENKALAERILPAFPFIKAEIVYAVTIEMALTIRDFLARRIRLEIMDWEATQKAAPVVGEWMGKCLGWSAADQSMHVAEYISLLNSFQSHAKLP